MKAVESLMNRDGNEMKCRMKERREAEYIQANSRLVFLMVILSVIRFDHHSWC